MHQNSIISYLLKWTAFIIVYLFVSGARVLTQPNNLQFMNLVAETKDWLEEAAYKGSEA